MKPVSPTPARPGTTRIQITRDESPMVRIRTETGAIIHLPRREAQRCPAPLAA